MSRIWAALPELDPLDPNAPAIPSGACWWRHPLPTNEDGCELIVRTDSTTDMRAAARLGCWEWFDGLDEQLILGVDVFRVAHAYEHGRSYIDVLAVDVPTRSPAWRNLTEPDDWHHRGPDYTIPSSAFTGQPYTVAPMPRR